MTATLPARHRWRDALVFSTDPRIDAYGLAVATALHVHMSPEGRCTVGLRRLASLARCTVPTVRARLGVLVDAGWLTVEGGDRERATYRAVLPADESDVESDEANAERVQHSVEAVQPEASAVQPHGAVCATRLHTYPLNPLNPRRRGWHDPSVGRPAPDRPPPDLGRLVERDDGTLWVAR